MRYYSVPADFKNETIDEYVQLNCKCSHSIVKETYGQITVDNSFCSGRTDGSLPQVDIHTLRQYVKYSRDRGISFNYTFNSSYMNNMEFTKNGVIMIKDFLYMLYDCGISEITVTLPTVIELIKSMDIDFKVTASVICQIDNVNKAMYYKKIGADRIVVSESINRKFDTLKCIVDTFGNYTKLIVNSLCYNDCIYRAHHYNQISGSNRMPSDTFGMDYYTHRCAVRLCENPSNVMRLCWVRPEDIHHYEEIGISYYKLHGRELVTSGNPVKTLESYFNEHFNGNLMDLLTLFSHRYRYTLYVDNKRLHGYIDEFIKRDFCTHNCECCGYCSRYSQNAIEGQYTENIMKLAEIFYDKLDPYLKEIRAIGGIADMFDIVNDERDGE